MHRTFGRNEPANRDETVNDEELTVRDYLFEEDKRLAVLLPLVAATFILLCGACMTATLFLFW